MSLNAAHEGYEYQDLLTVYYILSEILNGNNANFIIDRKLNPDDAFDDLTIERSGIILKKQIKYSNAHTLQKKDISANSSYQLAIDDLYHSWLRNKNNEVRLCLAWNEPTDDLVQILSEQSGNKTFISHPTRLFQINIDKLWPVGKKPLAKWKRFRESSQNINRNDFAEFCMHLYIETNFPKFSLNIDSPGELETVVFQQAELLGIGTFPNHHITVKNFVARLILKVKEARSKGHNIHTQSIFISFNIKTDYGAIEQNFPIDKQKNVITKRTINNLIHEIQGHKKVVLWGEPGSGKSWLVNNFMTTAQKNGVHIVKHFCYTDLKDQLQKERIKQNTLYGNLIFDILKVFPHLSEKKTQKYASTLSELNLLIQNIDEPAIIIIDGLDHIDRVYNFHNYTDLSRDEIEIIEILENIECTENVSILLASQPISKLNNISGFHSFEIPKWKKQEIISLLKKHNIENFIINEKELSQILLAKSEGNPLYLTYLIKELQKTGEIEENFINNLPAYSYNLKEYYTYLLTKLNTRESLPKILSGVNFYLSKNELKEITGEGDFIEEALSALSPILKTNISQDGYIIYHESFRRYVLDILKDKNVSIEQNVFKPTIDWFKSKNIFSYTKAYRYGLQFFYNCHQYQEIEQHITKEFIVNSVSWGQPWKSIECNIQIMAQSAIHLQNFSLMIIVNELFKTIGSVENSYESSFNAYMECMGMTKGFEYVSNFLTFEGEPTLDNPVQGLQVCYISSRHNAFAPWNLYFDYFKKGEKIQLEDFKYYVRYFIAQEDTKALVEISKKVVRKKLKPFEEIFVHEFETISNSEYQKNLLKAEPSITNICIKKKDDKHKGIDTLIQQIKTSKGFSEKETEIVADFINQCNIQEIDKIEYEKISKQLSGINWFYNWLIYCVKITIINNKTDYTFDEVKEAFSYLIYDTEPFKGEPRTCDLYYIQPVIYKSIKEGLRFVNSVEEWKYIINLVIDVSYKTGTSFQGSIGGPIGTDKLFALFEEIAIPSNAEYLLEKAIEIYEANKETLYFSYLSDFCFSICKLCLKANKKDDADAYFLLGSRYMVSYTWRRDITLFEAVECLSFLPQLDAELTKDSLQRTYELAESVIYHTDGKDTKWLPIYWFKEYVKIDSFEASVWLMNQLYKTRYYWILEHNLQNLLEHTQGGINPIVEQFISNSFIVENDESYIKTTININEKIANESPFLNSFFAKKIYTRLQNERRSEYSDSLNDKLHNYFSLLNIEYQPVKKQTPQRNKIQTGKKNNFRTKEFSDMSLSEIGNCVKKGNLSESDFHSLTYIFDNLKIDEESKQLIKDCVIGNSRYRFDDDIPLEKLGILFERNKELKIYFNVLAFVWTISGNGSIFHLKEKFKEAYSIDADKSIEYLFELLPIIFNGINRDFACNLLTALVEAGYDSKNIIDSVKNLIDCIEYKIPVIENKDWNHELENEFGMNQEEILISIMLIRSKAYTTERLIHTLTAFATLLYKEPNKLIKPLKWFFCKHEYFKESVILCVLDILYEYDKLYPAYIKNFTFELEKIYPKRYYLIDCLLERFLNKKAFPIILPSQSGIYPINRKDLETFLSFNNRLKKLDAIEIDVTSVVAKHKTIYLSKHKDKLDLYANRSYEMYVKHIYPSDYILQRINTDLYQDLRTLQKEEEDDCYDFLRINTKALIAQNLSFSLRPKDLTLPSQGKSLTEKYPIKNDSGWIRLAHYENELKKRDRLFDLKEYRTWGTCLGGFNNSTPLALETLYDYAFCLPDHGVLFEFIQYDPLENYHLFWLNPIILEQLGIVISDFLTGIVAKNENDEVVLKYNQWKTNYVGNGDFGIREEIPTIEGVELLIREDYFKKMQRILGKQLSEYVTLFLNFKDVSKESE